MRDEPEGSATTAVVAMFVSTWIDCRWSEKRERLINLQPTDTEANAAVSTDFADPPVEPRCALPSFEEIVQCYQRDVRLYVAKFLGNHAAVDDVAQDVFVQVYRGLNQYAGHGSLKAWILGIARHQVGTWFRNQSRRIRFRTLDVESDLIQCRWQEWQREHAEEGEPSQHGGVDAELELALLRGCLEKLRPPQRTLVQRYYFNSETAEDIGRKDGRNSGAIRMALLRIRESLAKCIRQQAARRLHHE